MKTHSHDFSYTPGEFTCLANWPVCLLIDLAPSDPRLPELVGLLDGEPTIEAVVDQLSRDGVTATPSFGLIRVDQDPAPVVVHGDIRAIIDNEELPGTRFFAEAMASPLDQLSLSAGGEAPGSDGLRISSGVVRAATVTWRVVGDGVTPEPLAATVPPAPVIPSAPASKTPFAPAPVTPSAPTPVPPAATPVPVVSGPEDHPQPPAAAESNDDSVFAHLFNPSFAISADRAADAPVQDHSDPDPEATAFEPAVTARDPGQTQISPWTTDLSELGLADFDAPDAITPSRPATTDPTPKLPGFIESFEWEPRFAEKDLGQPVAQRQPAPPVPSAPPPDPPTPPPAPRPPRQDQEQPSMNTPAVALQTSLPTRSALDSTVRKSSLTQLNGDGQVMVVAFACQRGHYSPPYATLCRICGVSLDQHQVVVEIPRPTLGVLRLWGGGTVQLDRGVIFGRNPRPIAGLVGPEASLVKIDDPGRDVSSQHCEVRLEDWYVTIRDLDSTNGTQVILPHRPPVTLRAHDPMAIEPGTRVVLANAFDFVFEVV